MLLLLLPSPCRTAERRGRDTAAMTLRPRLPVAHAATSPLRNLDSPCLPAAAAASPEKVCALVLMSRSDAGPMHAVAQFASPSISTHAMTRPRQLIAACLAAVPTGSAQPLPGASRNPVS